MKFNENLKKIRLKLKLTQEELAKLVNIPIGTIRDWEQGSIPKTLESLKRIKDILGCSYDDLLE